MRPITRMSRRQCLRSLGVLAVPCVVPVSLRAAAREWRVSGHDIPELRSFDQTIERYMRARNIRYGALAVSRRGRLLLARGYAWDETPDARVDPMALFRIASLSKPLTAAMVLRLAQQGQLELEAPLTSLVPLQPRSGRRPDPRLGHVTVLHLLQHLGGWDRGRNFDPMFHDAAISRALGVALPIDTSHINTFMAGEEVTYHPGTVYSYSNYGYSLLGRVIERATGLPYEEAVRDTLLRPWGIAGMRLGRTLPEHRAEGEVPYESIGVRPTVLDGSGRRVSEPYGAFNLENLDSHGGWLASTVDLARFAGAFDGEEASGGVLSEESIGRTFAPPAVGLQGAGWYYGCGWSVRPLDNDRRTSWHTGSLPGTTAVMVRRWDGLQWAALFSQRDDPSDPRSATYMDIDPALHVAADAVQDWPDHDLFGEYLPRG